LALHDPLPIAAPCPPRKPDPAPAVRPRARSPARSARRGSPPCPRRRDSPPCPRRCHSGRLAGTRAEDRRSLVCARCRAYGSSMICPPTPQPRDPAATRPRGPAAPGQRGPATGRLSDSARESRQEGPMRNDHRYVLGESENEHSRLRDQSVVLDPLTRSLLIDAGITEGMRVLDIGTGSGAVAALAADLVCSHGHVLAIDRDPTALDGARAVLARHPQVEVAE